MVKKFIMFPLDSKDTGDLAEALQNNTCKKILDLLVDKNLSQTEISEKLKVPVSTISYNVEKLVKVGLIEEKSHFFSIRGKRVPVYKISDKQIIISPKKKTNVLNSVSLVGISGLFTGFILWYRRSFEVGAMRVNSEMLFAAEDAVAKTSPGLTFGVLEYFLIGTWLMVVLIVALSHVKINFKFPFIRNKSDKSYSERR